MKQANVLPFTIIGRNAAGNIMAEDRTDHPGKASQIAAAWKASGLEVEVIETGHLNGPNLAGARGRPEPAAQVLGHSGASI